MDLQSILSTPCGNVPALYYTRKISVYNFTIYNQETSEGYCMIWDETKGKRGAVEIGSLLFRYLRDHVPSDVKHMIITSDSTMAQNRNQYIAALLLIAVQCLRGIEMTNRQLTVLWVHFSHKSLISHSIALLSVGSNLDHVKEATCQKDVSLVLLSSSWVLNCIVLPFNQDVVHLPIY